MDQQAIFALKRLSCPDPLRTARVKEENCAPRSRGGRHWPESARPVTHALARPLLADHVRYPPSLETMVCRILAVWALRRNWSAYCFR